MWKDNNLHLFKVIDYFVESSFILSFQIKSISHGNPKLKNGKDIFCKTRNFQNGTF